MILRPLFQWRPIEVGASQPRQVWFSFDNTTVLSISELSPCVPRLCYIVLRSCIYQTHSFISDIYRRIYISVMMGSTLRTIPLSYRKIFRFCIFVTTNRTGLAACKKSTHLHKFLTLILQFVSQKCYKTKEYPGQLPRVWKAVYTASCFFIS